MRRLLRNDVLHWLPGIHGLLHHWLHHGLLSCSLPIHRLLLSAICVACLSLHVLPLWLHLLLLGHRLPISMRLLCTVCVACQRLLVLYILPLWLHSVAWR